MQFSIQHYWDAPIQAGLAKLMVPLTLACLLAVSASGAYAAQPSSKPIAQVRVAFDRKGITSTDAEGFADLSTQRKITADDPVRVASVSKLVAAIAVMRLVEQGKLNLDADVSKQLGWPLRNPAFPAVPITLRMLLSHTSSVTDNAGYWNVPLGEQLRDTLLADPKAWDSQHVPGTFFRYSNLNFPLVAQLMERATGERFDILMQRLVIQPLGLSACYNWSGCGQTSLARAVVLYDAESKPQKDDLHGRAPDCVVINAKDGSCDIAALWKPGANGTLYSPQGGLRISANDLAKIGRLLLNDGRVGKTRLLKSASVRALLAPVWTYDGGNGAIIEEDEPDRGGFFCRYGLAMQHLANGDGQTCRDDLFGDKRKRVGHSGNAYGVLSGLWIDQQAGTGVAYFVTGASNSSNGQHSAFSATEEQMAAGHVAH